MLRSLMVAVLVGGLSLNAQAECVGDVNGDSAVNLGELQMCVNSFLGNCDTPTQTVTATPTPTPGADDCCDAGFLCGPPNGGGCTIGVLVYGASCNGVAGQCVTFSPTPTSTPTHTPGHFADNFDGTITDNLTGRMWEKKTDDGSIHDKDNTYAWSTGSPYSPNGTVFTVFLNSLNGGVAGVGNCISDDGVTQAGGFAGHCDWRLPTIAELQTLLLEPYPCASRTSSQCIDPVFGLTQSQLYWSATTTDGAPGSVWGVYFSHGALERVNKTTSSYMYVRAVRGGP